MVRWDRRAGWRVEPRFQLVADIFGNCHQPGNGENDIYREISRPQREPAHFPHSVRWEVVVRTRQTYRPGDRYATARRYARRYGVSGELGRRSADGVGRPILLNTAA